MSIDLDQAASFLTRHGRVLDRRRFALIAEPGPGPERRRAVLAALGGYRNPDGGFGWGMEPDLRASESQPGGALHAWEAIADAGEPAADTPGLLDWLERAALEDGGLPFALPIADPAGCAPFWTGADPTVSSLQITAAVATQAHRAARFDQRIITHPWLDRATRYCFDAIAAIGEAPFAYVLSFALQLLDAASDTRPEALELLRHLGKYVPADGAVPVAGGAEGETLHLLDYAPFPDRPVRALLDQDAVRRDLDRLAHGQREDGGWAVDFDSYSAAAALEWRGCATVSAVSVLSANGLLG